MLISDAIPVQFWLNGEPSFNELDEAGVDKICFYQPFNADDEIRIQLKDDSGNIISLIIYDENGDISETLNFEEVSTGVYFLEFTISNEGLFKLEITRRYLSLNSQFDSNLDGWSNIPGSGPDWAWNSEEGGSAKVTVSSGNTSDFLSKSLVPVTNDLDYILKVNVVLTSGLGKTLDFIFLDGGGVIHNVTAISNSGEYEFTVPSSVMQLADEIRAAFSVTTGTRSAWIRSAQLYSVSETKAYSDFIDIQENHLDTRLISYTNELDFAGIQYDVDYPPTFHIRVKSKFYTPRNQQETESEPDAEGNVIKLSSSSKKQKQLVIDPVPPYMHDKLILILQHNSIYINNRSWVQEDNYEINEINERFGLFSGSVWLTQMDDNFYTNVG